MGVLRVTLQIALILTVWSGLAAADSIELRSGRHVQGKYIGGTSDAIGFMTGTTVEYFPTSDVLALIFDNGLGTSSSGWQTRPMKGVTKSKKELRRTQGRGRSSHTRQILQRVSDVRME